MEKIQSFQQMVLGKFDSHMQKNETRPPSYTIHKNPYLKCIYGKPGWLSGLAPAFSPGRDPEDLGSNPALGSLHGAYFSLCFSLCIS